MTVQYDHQRLHDHVQALDARERQLLSLRYGGVKIRSSAEVPGSMGVTKGQVQSFEWRVLRKLRHRLTPVLHPRES